VQPLVEGCNKPVFKQIIIPPHRSQLILVKLLINKTPANAVKLEVRFKLYRWFNSDHFEDDRKYHKPEILTDTIMLKPGYENSNESDQDAQKVKLIPPITAIHMLTDNVRKLYTLTVNETEIKKSTGRRYAYVKGKVFLIPVKVHNNGDDTLKYFTWGCSWPEYYHSNNEYFKTPESICEWNPIIQVSILPHSFHKDVVPFVFKEKNVNHIKHLKVGLNINKTYSILFPILYYQELKIDNIVWSNEVQFTTK